MGHSLLSILKYKYKIVNMSHFYEFEVVVWKHFIFKQKDKKKLVSQYISQILCKHVKRLLQNFSLKCYNIREVKCQEDCTVVSL